MTTGVNIIWLRRSGCEIALLQLIRRKVSDKFLIPVNSDIDITSKLEPDIKGLYKVN